MMQPSSVFRKNSLQTIQVQKSIAFFMNPDFKKASSCFGSPGYVRLYNPEDAFTLFVLNVTPSGATAYWVVSSKTIVIPL
jgi:hypothetical protein